MKEMRLHYPLPLMRRIMNVSASGYYAWIDRPPSKWSLQEARLELEIKVMDKRTRHTYGAERLQRELVEQGVQVGICRLAFRQAALEFPQFQFIWLELQKGEWVLN